MIEQGIIYFCGEFEVKALVGLNSAIEWVVHIHVWGRVQLAEPLHYV